MSPELFEQLAGQAFEADRSRMEMFGGRVWSRSAPDGAHTGILAWLVREFLARRAEIALITSGLGLKVGAHREERARPDGILVPAGLFDDAGDWADPGGVLAVVEVTFWDADTLARDRVEEPAAYAETGIDLYLLVDRDANALVVHSRPVQGQYLDRSIYPFGEAAPLPGMEVALDTEPLERFAR
ncbi:Uma2 family endonuclease [Nocardiopsis exhalans]|uniref:Uma2 family endonuclease n=1 Tax=Nocardiopsis exhalans TaxID=163604 RepID=A0ABY5DDW1_9ACTN|nr:Uma2 family endonuclease [Nocardiopsis exhalans]USY21312.1 Uma2 family endonuclease [Nocardiopsis exhalans]